VRRQPLDKLSLAERFSRQRHHEMVMPAASRQSTLSPADAEKLTRGLLVFCTAAINPAMKITGANISEQIVRGRVALRDNSRALSSLLLLGLTRGCRVR
jgi:hypothetical protein